MPFLSRQSRGQVLVLAPLADHADAAAVLRFVDRPRRERRQLACGPSASTSASPPPCPDSTWCLARPARRASRCVTRTWPAGGPPQIVAFDDLGRRYKVLDSLRDDQLQELEDAVVGRLIDADRLGHSDLLRTLETYLACGGSAADAAAELYVHRNTLRKRWRGSRRSSGST